MLNLSNKEKFSKYGNNLIISQWNQDKLIINLDELTDKFDPYISIYFRQSRKQNKSFINEDKDSNVEYACVLLDNKSSKELSRLFQTKNPKLKNWKLHCHHMTIINSQLPENTLLKDEQIQLQVIFSGINELCAAVKVKILDSEIDQTVSKIRKSSNKFNSNFLYIIMATSPIGKSNNVNSITEWHELENQIKLNGYVQEI